MVVFDLDNTLRDSSCGDHMIPQDVTKARNWIEWQSYVNEHGDIIQATLRLYRLLHHLDKKVVVTSSQFGTQEWLDKYGIEMDWIVERDEYDDRHGFDFKMSFIDSYSSQIELWIDDDPKVLDYVESLGILNVRINPGVYRRDDEILQ